VGPSGAVLAAALAALGALVATAGTARADGPRLLVMDVPYERVWERVLRALEDRPVARAADGVIETARVERPPRADEAGVDRVAERVTVHVEPVAPLVTRITVDARREGLRAGRWEPLPDGEAAARAVLDRIRAARG
jgi:hypothetical protein